MHILGIDGLGGESARCEFIKVKEMLCFKSLSDGNGANCAKDFSAVASSVGR